MEALIIGLVAGILAFLGAVLGHWVTRKGAVELDTWRKREETMRMVRWAAEMAADAERPWRSYAGFHILDALGESELLQSEDVSLVHRITTSMAETMAQALAPGYPEEETRQQEESS